MKEREHHHCRIKNVDVALSPEYINSGMYKMLDAVWVKGCCGADKRVDPAIDLSLMRASSDSQRQ